MVVDYKSRKNEVLESYEKLEALISDLHEYLKKIELPDPIEHLEVLLRDIRSKAEKVKEPIELHHLGQKADSPLVELTEEEHRTGEYEDGKKIKACGTIIQSKLKCMEKVIIGIRKERPIGKQELHRHKEDKI